MRPYVWRAGLCPLLVVVLITVPFARAVDPIDFLESLKDDEDPQNSPTEYPNGVNVIPGEAEINYPVYSSIPKSSFSCIGRPVGFYADTELRCQVWHICDEDRRQQSFLCTNGTVYSQEKRVCDWWYNVNCDPNEVSRNYQQNYDLYKGPSPKSENDHNNNISTNNEYTKNKDDFESSPKAHKDPFYAQASSRQNHDENRPRYKNEQQRYNNNNDQQYTKPPTSFSQPPPRGESSFSDNQNFQSSSPQRRQPPPSTTRKPTTTTTTFRPPTTYNTPAPPAALQGSSFPPPQPQPKQKRPQHQQSQPQAQQSRVQPSIKTTHSGGKRIVEIRVPLSQIPPEILAKYGKRIPEHILKEIFVNFTRGQQQQLQQEAISNSKPNNPTGAGNSRSAPPKAPIPQNTFPKSPSPPTQSKKPVDFNSSPSSKAPTATYSSPPPKNSHPPPPPPPPPPSEPQQKFRHSTPRRVENVKFATPTRELLAEYDEERQEVGESQNPVYSLQQLFSTHHSRTSGKSKSASANELKESFNFDPTTPPTEPPYQQEFTRSQPRRRIHKTTTTQRTTTTEEPELITDRYRPVATEEEKKNADIRRIFLVARQGIKVLPPIPVLASEPQSLTPRRIDATTQRLPLSLRTTTIEDFSRIPPAPKVAIPDDYYVKNERFQEAESRYPFPTPSTPSTYIEPRHHSRHHQRPTSTSTTTVTTTTSTTPAPPPPPPPPPFFPDQDFRRTKPSKPQQNKKKALPPPEEKKDPDNYSDYDDDGSQNDNVNEEELELLRLAQQYIELTGQEFGVRKQPRNA